MTTQSRRRPGSLERANTALTLELVHQESSLRATQPSPMASANNEFFMERAGVRCAGAHLIIDLYDANRLDDLDLIESTMKKCVEAAGATLLHIHLHPFEPNGGISGVAVLAESHISIHTWPEQHYAALDIFMCGNARPERCIEVLLEAFTPRRVAIEELLRGRSV
jgi:S-adenosylmethionine decarboxylase